MHLLDTDLSLIESADQGISEIPVLASREFFSMSHTTFSCAKKDATPSQELGDDNPSVTQRTTTASINLALSFCVKASRSEDSQNKTRALMRGSERVS